MGDRVPSDHETIETHRVTLETIGRTSRPKIDLPDAITAADGDVVRVTFDETDYHARIEGSLDGTPQLRGAYDNARLAKSDEGENRLAEWVERGPVEPGRSVLVDVLTAGYHYGLREPGARVVYDVREPPEGSLVDIANTLDESG